MDSDRFWAIIERSRDGSADSAAQARRWVEQLKELPEDEIVAFQRHYDECESAAYRWDLWAAASIINRHCSDDAFIYFIGWLIAQGRHYFESTLADPQHAGERIAPGECVDGKPFRFAAQRAYHEKTGRDDFDARCGRGDVELKGEQWHDDELEEMFPQLAAKFRP